MLDKKKVMYSNIWLMLSSGDPGVDGGERLCDGGGSHAAAGGTPAHLGVGIRPPWHRRGAPGHPACAGAGEQALN